MQLRELKNRALADVQAAVYSDSPMTFYIGPTKYRLKGRQYLIKQQQMLQKKLDKLPRNRVWSNDEAVWLRERLAGLKKMLTRPEVFVNKVKKLPLHMFNKEG